MSNAHQLELQCVRPLLQSSPGWFFLAAPSFHYWMYRQLMRTGFRRIIPHVCSLVVCAAASLSSISRCIVAWCALEIKRDSSVNYHLCPQYQKLRHVTVYGTLESYVVSWRVSRISFCMRFLHALQDIFGPDIWTPSSLCDIRMDLAMLRVSQVHQTQALVSSLTCQVCLRWTLALQVGQVTRPCFLTPKRRHSLEGELRIVAQVSDLHRDLSIASRRNRSESSCLPQFLQLFRLVSLLWGRFLNLGSLRLKWTHRCEQESRRKQLEIIMCLADVWLLPLVILLI